MVYYIASVLFLLFLLCPCMTWQVMVLYSILVYILLFTQAPILVWFDGTIIGISTILVTMYYSGYVEL